MPSELEIYAFPRLKSAKREVNANQRDYKSGASFSGNLKGVQRSGTGAFSWPNGDKYTGEYVDNVRHGKGEQLWADGSKFTGTFLKDVRHGYGEIKWQNGESFQGNYFKDHRHGEGVYTWPDGSSFRGTFYKNRKEGYGVFKFPSGKRFEGLYKDDERRGPGLLTYPDGLQDFGLWHKERLINFCSTIEETFSLSDHEHCGFNQEELITGTEAERMEMSERKSDLRDCLSPEVGSGDASSINLRDIMNSLEKPNYKTDFEQFQPGCPESIDLNSLTYDREEYDREFFGEDAEPVAADDEKDTSLMNRTPSYIAMMEHISKHRNRENTMPFAVSDILKGNRSCHGDRGPIERASVALITAAGEGDYDSVNSLVVDGAVDVNVADKNGSTALLCAAVNMHQKIINVLLDNGADVNKLNDEGLSALAACHVLFYPTDSFKYNIAERYLPRPPGEDRGLMPEDGSQGEGSERRFTRGSRPPSSHRSRDLLSASSHESSLIYNNASVYDYADRRADRDRMEDEGDDDNNEGEEEEEEIDDKDDFFDLVSSAVTEEHVMVEDDRDEDIPEWDPDAAESETRVSLGNGLHRQRGPTSSSHRTSDSPTEVETKAETGTERDTYSLLDFESNTSMAGYRIQVTEDMIERSATVMSQNKGITSGRSSKCSDPSLDEARRRAIAKAEHSEMEATIRLLLKRGADPNSSSVPMPVAFFAVKATDVEAVQVLLEKGAVTTSRLSRKMDGLSTLHIASALRGPEGVEITRLILEAGADPNIRAFDDQDEEEEFYFTSGGSSPVKIRSGLDDSVFQHYYTLQEVGDHKGGRTSLHIACSRDDDYELSRQIVRLLLERGANPNVLCMGQSPLSLAIASGNDLAVDELLRFGANPSLPLGHHTGSALCIASNTRYEFRREPSQRIALIDKLVDAGANILAPVPVGSKKQMGTAVDYAYWMFNQDKRIAHMPYHALTYNERDTYNARRKLLAHLGNILRSAAVQRERERLHHEATEGTRSVSPSQDFLYTGAGARLESPTKSIMATAKAGARKESAPGSSSESLQETAGGKQVVFHSVIKDNTGQFQPLVDKENGEPILRKPLFKYCYECGRTLGVRLSACTRCKEVYYCSKACKVKGWNARHKEECVRVNGRSRSPSPSGKGTNDGGRQNSSAVAAGRNNTGGSGGMRAQGTSSRQQHGNSGNSQDKTRGKSGTSGAVRGGNKSKPGGDNRSQGRQTEGTKGSVGGHIKGHKKGKDDRDNMFNQSRKEISENYSYN
ncbi:ankyrin repeat and MYND domain-containing protein 1-like isoform X2 [Apostichopus japonicus]|uniref:ankyrin repeat and MYND domain-containing protein 1-like isoform X2 n=1 Tax=Stichopus japonicus TaxID=307972 RepID=UPI003AB2FA97